MTSQIVFMEHSPLTMLKRANNPQSLGNFLYSICNYPHHGRSRDCMEYIPTSEEDPSQQGTFHLTIMHDQVEFRGTFFRNQLCVNNYLINRGIAIKLGLVNMTDIRSRVGSGAILFIEEMKYSGTTLSSMAISRAKALLKIPSSTTGHYDRDRQFLGVKAGKLVHTRSGDLIPSNEWVPLYRPGSIFGPISDDAPINLETCEHVIF